MQLMTRQNLIVAVVVVGILILAAGPSTWRSDTADAGTASFSADAFYWDESTRPHQQAIVDGVNRLARTNPRCKESISPGSASLSPSKTAANGAPTFFVQCGAGNNVETVYFQ